MKIGFIGLGNMGAPMAANLVAAGHQVTGFDVAGVTVEGVAQAATGAEAANGAEIVITMLPNGAILRSVAAEVLPAMTKGAVLLDCSTVDVASARDVATEAEAAGIGFLDAPVSGGVGGRCGRHADLHGGWKRCGFRDREAALRDHGPEGGALRARRQRTGRQDLQQHDPRGDHDRDLRGLPRWPTSWGLDRQAMYDVVSTSSGYSWSMNAYCPAPGIGPTSPADNDYRPGFAADLMLKDLRLSQQAAEAVDADTPMGARAMALYAQFVEEEDGKGRDFSAMLPRFERRGRSD